MKIQVFKSPVNRQWYFHLKARNGKLIAQSEGYHKKASAIKTAKRLLFSFSVKVTLQIPNE